MTAPTFRGGPNVAMKIPRAQFDQTVAFYRDVLGLEVREETDPEVLSAVSRSVHVAFGPISLWLDQVDNYTQPELWLELLADDPEAATRHLADHGIAPQDELEQLSDDDTAHWITTPGGIPHIVHGPGDSPAPVRGPDGVRQLRLVVEAADLDAAIAFYRDALGLHVENDIRTGDARVVILDAGRATLELVNPEQKAYIDDVEVGRPVSPPIRVAFEVTDTEAVTQRLVDAGAERVAEPTRTPWESINARLDAPADLHITIFQEPDTT